MVLITVLHPLAHRLEGSCHADGGCLSLACLSGKMSLGSPEYGCRCDGPQL